MYQAFYRKYRPRHFSDVAGQEHITETLRRQIVSDRLSHAYLFVGTRGTGKTTCAKILSRAVNCLAPEEGEPCNKCMACIGIEEGSILDVLELDAASNNSVDNVRALRDEAIYSPATVKKRVYIIDEVHMLSISAFNALLKILEEPPEHILFILATTELHKVPATILSRCQKFSFKRLPPAVLKARLALISADEGFTLTEDAAAKLASLADGSMRDAISLLDQCASDDVVDLARVQNTLGLTGRDEISRIIDAVAERSVTAVLGILDGLYNDGRDMSSLLGEMALLMRDLLVFKLSPDSGLLSAGYDHSALTMLTSKMAQERLFYCLDVLKTAISGLTRGGSSKLAVEMCLIRMCDERLSDDASALVSRISRLEAGAPVIVVKTEKPVDPEIVDTNVHETEKPADPDIMVQDDHKTDEPVDPAEESINEVNESINYSAVTEEAVDSDDISETSEGAVDSGDYWLDILELLKNDPSVHALLGDSSKVRAKYDDGSLLITVTDSFTSHLIKSDFSEHIKEAARKIFDRDVIIHVETGEIGTDENKRSKLESLSAFGIVNFE